MNIWEVQYWSDRDSTWRTDFSSNNAQQIQRVFDSRQKPIKEKIRVIQMEDVTRFFDL